MLRRRLMNDQQYPQVIVLKNYGGRPNASSSEWYSDGGNTEYTGRKCREGSLQSENIFLKDTKVEITIHVKSSAQYYHYFAVASTQDMIVSDNQICTFFYAVPIGSLVWERKEATYTMEYTARAGTYLYIAAWLSSILEVTDITITRYD